MLARNKRPLYKRWQQFYYSTTTPGSHLWICYGAQGLKMYRDWAIPKIGFDLFEDWVYSNLGRPPKNKPVLGLINRKKGVQPGNLHWTTRLWIHNHRRDNYMIKIGHKRQSLADWSRETGVNKATAWTRLHDMGMTAKEAFEL